jgi:hypothetical protein
MSAPDPEPAGGGSGAPEGTGPVVGAGRGVGAGRVVGADGVLEVARETKGFMPHPEGLALAQLAGLVERGGSASAGEGRGREPLIIEIGAYCGRSTLYLAAGLVGAASPPAVTKLPAPGGAPGEGGRRGGGTVSTIVFSVDHHHGSEENQAGWEHHDSSLVNPATGRLDTLPHWRAAIESAGVEDFVIAVVGDSPTVAARWSTPADLVFIDGGHGEAVAWADYWSWAPLVVKGGFLAIHDVFPDPADGGRPPYELYCRAISSRAFSEQAELCCGSLRVLRRIGAGA